jgi:hypothetical protein
MKKLFLIAGLGLMFLSCEHTINNYGCKCNGTCCQPQDSTMVEQGLDSLEEKTEVFTEEGEQ